MQRPPWLGKLIGAAIGFALLRMPGLLLGLLVGHGVDQMSRIRKTVGGSLQQAKQTFFETTFTLMGKLAKSDGQISEQEIKLTEQLMTRMGLSAEHRQEAIALFKRGASPEFDVDTQIRAFLAAGGSLPQMRQMVLMFLFNTAAADGGVSAQEHDLLAQIARNLGFSAAQFEQMLRMFTAQDHFSQRPGAPPPTSSLADAYAALGVAASDSDRDVKLAYRRLMQEYHPDKLIAEGVPEDMIKLATERTQEIQNAWEQIRKARGIS
jgi:DnaJ like chaperone protein